MHVNDAIVCHNNVLHYANLIDLSWLSGVFHSLFSLCTLIIWRITHDGYIVSSSFGIFVVVVMLLYVPDLIVGLYEFLHSCTIANLDSVETKSHRIV